MQGDDGLVAISFNRYGSWVGKVVADVGVEPSVDVGDFDSNAADQKYVNNYRTIYSNLASATYQGDGRLTNDGQSPGSARGICYLGLSGLRRSNSKI